MAPRSPAGHQPRPPLSRSAVVPYDLRHGGENTSRSGPRRIAGGAVGYVRTRNRKQKAAGAAGILLATSAPFGGLEAVATPEPGEFKAGEIVALGPFDVTVKKVVTVSDLAPSISPSEEGNRLIVISAKVHNSSDRPEFPALLAKGITLDGGGILFIPDTKEIGQPAMFLQQDGLRPDPTINPGLTYDVAFVYEQEAGWKSKPVTVKIGTFTYVDEGALTLDEDYWAVDPKTSAEAVIPVEVKP